MAQTGFNQTLSDKLETTENQIRDYQKIIDTADFVSGWCRPVTRKTPETHSFGSLMSVGYKKDIFSVFAYEFELLHKSRRSRVYHQNEVLHIINSAGIVYHHCESTIQPTADDIHLR